MKSSCCEHSHGEIAKGPKHRPTSRHWLRKYDSNPKPTWWISGPANPQTYSHAMRTAATHEPHPQPSRKPTSKASPTPTQHETNIKESLQTIHRDPSRTRLRWRNIIENPLSGAHTNEVKDYLDEREPNKVLHEKPPEISTKKTLLSKRTLAELRSGYSPYLNSNAKRISTVDYDCCPNCNIEPHTTRHLFNCKNIAGRLPENSCNRFVDRQSKKTA